MKHSPLSSLSVSNNFNVFSFTPCVYFYRISNVQYNDIAFLFKIITAALQNNRFVQMFNSKDIHVEYIVAGNYLTALPFKISLLAIERNN